ncbi:unnamed protein product, partial [Mesorhabditis spiculigera]
MRVLVALLALIGLAHASSCKNSLYVRWPGVRLNFRAVASGKLSLKACQSACSLGEDPVMAGKSLECAALNHQTSVDNFNHHCDVFQPHQLQNVDGFVEADDRYSFYWRYCVDSHKQCGNDHAFTFMSDRYMEVTEVIEVRHTSSLEDCLAECLNEEKFPCRSLSFNRTDGGCHMSANNQLTKPKAIRLNNNPNYRIDYYENNCYNLTDSYKFEYKCQDDGVLVTIDSKFPYTGALYGLYDFFTCRIEPKEQTRFEYFFPSPTKSKRCSDSIRYKGNDMVLDVVLSTDGVEPPVPDRSLNIDAGSIAQSLPGSSPIHQRYHGRSYHYFDKYTATYDYNHDCDEYNHDHDSQTNQSSIYCHDDHCDKYDNDHYEKARAPAKPFEPHPAPTTTTTTTAGPPGIDQHGAKPRQPVTFDIFHNGRPVEAVVVGNRIILDFTPHFPIPPRYMSVRGCQVEPIDPRYDWEKEPLPIIRDGCPSDLVGLACPPASTDHGMMVSIEAFRYQTTAHVQYTCLVRVCPFAECPQTECPHVEGCDVGPFAKGRAKRGLTLDDIRRALEADPNLQRQIGLSSMLGRTPAINTEQQLLALAGDHVVKRRLVVVNSEDQLRYYVRTGQMP